MSKKQAAEPAAGADDGREGPAKPVIRVADHPRASRAVRRTRAFAGLAGFVLAALLAQRVALPAQDVLLRALGAGIGAHCAAWLLAVTYWRAAILAEYEGAHRALEAAARARADELMRDAAAAAEAA